VARSSVLALVLAALLGAAASGCDARLPDPESPGAKLYAGRCNGCHRLYAPGLLKYEMWKLTVNRMQGEMARRGAAPLNGDEQELLLGYLEKHSAR